MATEYPTTRPTIDYPFSPIPHALLADGEMGCAEVRVYGVLAWMAFEQGGGTLQTAQAEIANRMNCSPRSVARPLAKLESVGWIERLPCQTGKGREADRYHLHSQRAESRSGTGAHRAESRGRDRAESRGPTSLKEEENSLTLLSEPEPPRDKVPAAQMREEFKEWYSEYPLKRARKEAEKAYLKARKEASATDLLTGARMYARLIAARKTAARPGEDVLVKHPATWLNKGCWLDDLDDDIRKYERQGDPFTGPEMRYG